MKTWKGLALAVAVLLIVGIFGPGWWKQVSRASPTPVPADAISAARDQLPGLRVVDPLPFDDYSRDFFGPAWESLEPGPCNTRNDVLQVWLHDLTMDSTHQCSVDSGWFIDPYTGHHVEFRRGPRTSAEVHIDHVVALADAWSKGASRWDPKRAQQFANDPLNLLPTQGWVNEDKGALDAGAWLPPNEGFWCYFVVQQILVKDRYDLGVGDAELLGLQQGLERC